MTDIKKAEAASAATLTTSRIFVKGITGHSIAHTGATCKR